jgi:hypothetical protein
MSFRFARIPARAAGFGLTAADWAVLHALCLHADRDGYAHPSLTRIAAVAHVARRSTIRCLTRLAKLGLIYAARTARGQACGNTQYRVLFDYLPEGDGDEAVTMHSDEPVTINGDGAVTMPIDGMVTEPCHQGSDEPVTMIVTNGFCKPLKNNDQMAPITGHITDQPTERTYQEENGKRVEDIGGPNYSDNSVEYDDGPPAHPGKLNGGAATDDGTPCLWPLGTGCVRPALPGKRMCAVHDARR